MVSRSPSDPNFNPSRVILEDLSSRLPRQQYETWFKSKSLDYFPPNKLVFSVPNRFHKNWLEVVYKDTIRHSARSIINQEPKIEFELPLDQREAGNDEAQSMDSRAETRTARGKRSTALSNDSLSSPIRKGHTFNNFVVGPCNRIACAASLAVSESTLRDCAPPYYNPLLIYGQTGLGKTHLLHACYLRYRQSDQNRPLYLTGEEFANRVIDASKRGSSWSFLKNLYNFDSLMVDDIHFLGNKERVQEEFYQLFNDFHTKGKQIILSCNCTPKNITGLSERLLSRFKMGLIAKLDAFDLETRISFLKRNAAKLGFDLPMDVNEALAIEFNESPRDLVGKLNQLFNILRRKGSSHELIDNIPELITLLKESPASSLSSKPIRIPDIHRAVVSYYKLKISDMMSSSRERSLVLARQIGMFLSRKLTQHSLEEIGNFFGGRDHATVIHSVQKIEKLSETDQQVNADVKSISRKLGELDF